MTDDHYRLVETKQPEVHAEAAGSFVKIAVVMPVDLIAAMEVV